MSNITFVTHLRYDHDDRLKNFQTILNYYSLNWPESKFIVVEDDFQHNKHIDSIKWPKGTSYYLMQNNGLYHRTKALNYGFEQSKTPIVVSLDTDCIVLAKAFNNCVKSLLNNDTVAWPYNGFFIDVSNKLHEKFINQGYNFNTLLDPLPNISKLQLCQTIDNSYNVRCTNTTHQGVGGIVMFNREKFLRIGGYNEKFIAWGAEDNEINKRVSILEHGTYRDDSEDSVCFHLFHRSALRNQHAYYESNFRELENVENKNKEQLLEYIKSWRQFEV
jgi:hypothetical protein